jgi:hypothetical protein
MGGGGGTEADRSNQALTLSNLLMYFPPGFFVHSLLITLMMMETASTPEMYVNFYETTWCNNPEDSHLHTCHHRNLKSHKQCLLQYKAYQDTAIFSL